MKTIVREGFCHSIKIVHLFCIVVLLQSCVATSSSFKRVESQDFYKNLPGQWEGYWFWQGLSGKIKLNITNVDGNKVYLTGSSAGSGIFPDTDEVYGRIENSALLLTWPNAGESGINETYKMKKDDTNNLVLDGRWEGANGAGKHMLEKIK